MDPAIQKGKRASLIGMVVSGGLAISKLVVGWMAGSTSVVADGMESAGDVLASGLIYVAMWVAAKPADADHPYGHGRLETLAGLAVGNALIATGALITWKSLQGLWELHQPPAAYAVWPLIASIIFKSWMAGYKFRVGKKIGSSALKADAWNDSVDILSGTVALVAVIITLYDPARFLAADHVGGAMVGLLVIVLGIQVSRETTLHLIDTMPEGRMLDEIRGVAVQVPGVAGVEKCFARKTGLRWHVDLHLEVDPALTVRAGHSIAEETRNKIKDDLPWVADVLVHVEPDPRAAV